LPPAEPDLIVNSMIPNRFPKDRDDEIAVGVVRLFIRTDVFLSLLYIGEGLGLSGDIILVNQDQITLMPVKYSLPDGAPVSVLDYQIKAKPAELAAKGYDGIILADDYRGVPVLAAYRNIMVTPDVSWGLVVKRDESEVFYPVWQRLIYSLAIGLAAMLGALALIAVMTKRISRPLMTLSRAAREAGAGNYSARASVDSSDEVGDLANAFNSMIERVENWHEEMNEKVRVRTLELNDLNQALKLEIAERKQTEEILEKEKKFSDTTIDSLPAIFYLFDDTGRFLRWNKNFERVSGYSIQEISRMHPLDLFSEEEREIVGKAIAEVFAKGEGGVEADFVSKGGSKTPYYFTGRQVILDGKQCLAGMGIDIAKSKEAEEALRESEKRVRSVVETASDAIICVDSHGQVILWNEAAEQIFGYSAEEMADSPFTDIMPERFVRAHREGMERAIATGGLADSNKTHEVMARRRDGTEFPVELSLAVWETRAGKFFTGILRDITERKQIEQTLGRNEELQRTILSTSPVGIGLSVERKMVWVNDAWNNMFGFGADDADFVNRSARVLYPSQEEFDRVGKALYTGLETGRSNETDAQMIRKDGSLFNAHVTIKAIDPSDLSKGTIASIMDITDRKKGEQEQNQLRDQLFQAQKMQAIGTLTGGIAHDFNNMLTIILGYSELLLEDFKEGDPRHDDLEKIVQTTRNGADLVQRLLTFSRQKDARPSKMNLNDQIRQIIKLLSKTIPKMVEINLILADDLALINADPSQMEQIVMNLAVNAARPCQTEVN